MAADTPVVISPAAGDSVRLDTILSALKNPYSGTGTQVEARWQISRTDSFPASAANLVHDTLLRENDDHAQGDDWTEIHVGSQLPGLQKWAPLTTYYLAVMVRNSSGQSSSWSASVSFTTAAADVSAATFRSGQ